ncbi:uncharacterized protein N7483_000556 [Penicillium malachiteum]|uniref:uncharacterized protein n=1 Tax=Penicillium malachiteum TaxID=1324776 RepID=UPI00254760A8|nr:uncharacterized protein N7483_000556 [Penicillium malachiteum]KAJ5735431.1 hypothetical protein N7483_000556 [Penicillium malachiteum]
MVTAPGSDSESSNTKDLVLKFESHPESMDEEVGSTSHPSTSIPNLDLIKSLQHTERDVFYSTYWEDICLPALHPMFKPTSLLTSNSPMLTHAILALASCNMSRLHAERRDSSRRHMGTYSPNLIHQTRSQLYYSLAIKDFTSLKQINTKSSLAFTVLVLFAYIESSMGNFEGFNCHVQGLERFLAELKDEPGEGSFNALLTAWMQIRFVVWWARAYFSRLDIHRNLPPVPLPRKLEGRFETTEERRVNVLNVMCESHRLNSKAILKHWSHDSDLDDEYEITYLKLAREAKKLDLWLSNLPIIEQPSDSESYSHLSSEGGLDRPIFFQSHDAALNFAYYVLARIMQCTRSLHHLQNRKLHEELEHDEEQGWIRLLLQIANGSSMQTSVSKNSYTIGFSGILLAVLLRCQDLTLSLEIERWLDFLHALQPTEDGAFPIYQTLGVARMVNQQRMMGREIYGVSQLEDDGGGFPKFTAYNSQSISSLLLHGVCNITGSLFTECVSIEV